ncbi:MAG: G-D-S-L family lipolytic protein [Gammaproteobacteria bacterium]|nr:G-D-S-L family lipolytic protein [Gammaproteobacteria bacterium]
MKNSIIKLAGLGMACAVLAACDSDFDNPVGDSASYSSGTADFSNYVSLGDSLTAGYADGALYLSAQQNSYPAILARQLATVGGGTFTQPLVSDNLGGLLFGGNPNPDFGNRLIFNAATSSPEPIAGTPTTEVFAPLTGSFNNMGVPGAKSFHLGSAGYGSAAGLQAVPATANPYYVRFASSTTASMIADAASQQPSFFTLWIGNNDVLSYATTGGEGSDQTGNANPASYDSNDITDPTAFAGVYTSLVGAFTTANPAAKGVLLNIPDVSSIPFFTTVPYNPVPLDSATAAAVNAGYNSTYNPALSNPAFALSAAEISKRTISFAAGTNNAVVITDDEGLTDLTGFGVPSIRHATANDLIILTASSKIGTLKDNDPTKVWGVSEALVDGDALVPEEIDAINTARTAFNAAIKALADADSNLLYIDVAALMQGLKTDGINYGTGTIFSTYATGGGFSLDGVHPTARGYAIIANEIIKTINTGFNANIPPVDPGAYSTVFIK